MSGSPLRSAEAAIAEAMRCGADAAEAMALSADEREILVRLGRIERADGARTRGIGLRVFVGASQGLAHTTEAGAGSLRRLAEEAVAIARHAAADPLGALPEPHLTAPSAEEIPGLFDDRIAGLSDRDRIALARTAEEAATAPERIVNSEGSTFADRTSWLGMASTTGLAWEFRATRCSLASRPLAGGTSGSDRQVQMWYTAGRRLADLEPAAQVGERAAARALRMLGARPAPTGRASVLFDPLEAGRFWAGLLTAFSGDAVRKGLSFVAGTPGEPIASRVVTLVDDGRLPSGIASLPRDGEGLPTRRKEVVAEGLLRTLLHDCRSARQASASPTANAVRGYTALPSVGAFNFYLAPGTESPESILGTTRRGLLVTHAIGFGINLTTGDYSRGANGLWIEGGEIVHPVQEVVISGNLREMLRGISAVGNDASGRSAIASPTFRIDEMVISGRPDSPGGQL